MQLEALQRDKEAAQQESNLKAADEMTQMQATIHGLRQLLEQSDAKTQTQIEATRRTQNAEIEQLRGTVTALRVELEKVKTEHEVQLLSAHEIHRDEVSQLRDTIVAIRKVLEEAHVSKGN